MHFFFSTSRPPARSTTKTHTHAHQTQTQTHAQTHAKNNGNASTCPSPATAPPFKKVVGAENSLGPPCWRKSKVAVAVIMHHELNGLQKLLEECSSGCVEIRPRVRTHVRLSTFRREFLLPSFTKAVQCLESEKNGLHFRTTKYWKKKNTFQSHRHATKPSVVCKDGHAKAWKKQSPMTEVASIALSLPVVPRTSRSSSSAAASAAITIVLIIIYINY